MSRLLADLRYALRQLRRGPGFAATAILTLALGVAANVIVFGVIDALFLRPSSIPQASQLSFIQHREDNDVTMSLSQLSRSPRPQPHLLHHRRLSLH